ncbi:MAG: hypothetical protein ACLSHL_15850 [Alistipes communis]
MDYLDLLYDDLLSQGIAHPDWMLGAMAGALTAFFVQLYYWLGRYGGLPASATTGASGRKSRRRPFPSSS